MEAAWRLSGRAGLAGWSLRELAKAVGLAAPTIYSYFDAKRDIYDAMFRQGYEHLEATAERWDSFVDTAPPRAAFKAAMREFLAFCTSDPTRYQLLFQRVIPDFVPSAEAYGLALGFYDRFRRQLARIGVTDQEQLDLWTAISSGLIAQQISNDPGGDRWERLVDPAVDLFCDHVGVAQERAGR